LSNFSSFGRVIDFVLPQRTLGPGCRTPAFRLLISRFWRFQPFHDRIKLKHTFFAPHENKQMLILHAAYFVHQARNCLHGACVPGFDLWAAIAITPNREQLKVLQGSMDCESHDLNLAAHPDGARQCSAVIQPKGDRGFQTAFAWWLH
jgi:hypothetical protein